MQNFYLGYLSAESFRFSHSDFSAILAKSRHYNIENNITGILLYIEGSILQVLEGEEKEVKRLFEKIYRDERHTGVSIILEGYSVHRTFPEWSMAFKSITPGTPDFNHFIDLNLKRVGESFYDNHHPVLIFLKSFYLGFEVC